MLRRWAGVYSSSAVGNLERSMPSLGGDDDLAALEGGFHQVAFGDAGQGSQLDGQGHLAFAVDFHDPRPHKHVDRQCCYGSGLHYPPWRRHRYRRRRRLKPCCTISQAPRRGRIPRRAWSATRPATLTGLLSTAAQRAGAWYSSWIPPAARPCCTTSRAGPTGETLPAV